MTELRLKFKTSTGEEKTVVVGTDVFTIGRHSENSLTITDSRLSRDHLRIERDGGDFLVSDPGSSNGTTLNGDDLFDAAVLKNGDVLNLGEGVEIKVELVSADTAADDLPQVPNADAPTAAATFAPSPTAAPAADNNSIPTGVFIIAPVLGILILILVGGMIYFFGGGKQPEIADVDNGYNYSDDDDDRPKNVKDTTATPGSKSATPIPLNTANNTGTTETADGNTQPQATETGKIEQNGAAFLRRIAQNDPKAFLTGDQAQKVSAKVKQLGKSSALADNINSARRNAAQIRTLAAAKNLKPQFLAVAAISKLGSGRGDVLQTAQSLAEVYDKLSTHIGTEMADDSLLMIAAYDQGAAGDVMKMRNMLQDLANKSPESTRAIRTIWFLEKNGKITQAEFDRALNFLAIGTITQNPKEFGVNAEPLVL